MGNQNDDDDDDDLVEAIDLAESSDDQASSEGVDDDDSVDSNDEDVQALRRKIEEALKVNGVQAATTDSDDASDDDLMDDDQMMAIDEQLAEVFRSRVNEKKMSKGWLHMSVCVRHLNIIQMSTRNGTQRTSKTGSSISLTYTSRSSPQVNISSAWFCP